jgi:hypothetical protein
MIIKYILNILVSIDQLINTLAGGSPDETISSRLARNYPNSFLTKLIDKIFFWDESHCQKYLEPADRNADAILKGGSKKYARKKN